MTGEGEVFHIVERQFTGPSWGPDTQPWRQIALLTGPDSDEAAEAFARLQTTNYRHPARYRVLQVVVTHVFTRPTVVGPLGPDDGICRCTDSVRSVTGRCPRSYDREYAMCPKRAAPRPLLEVLADEVDGRLEGIRRESVREVTVNECTCGAPGDVDPADHDEDCPLFEEE